MNLSKRYLRYSHENLTLASAPFVFQYHVTYVEHRSEYKLDHRMFKEVRSDKRISLSFLILNHPNRISFISEAVCQVVVPLKMFLS